MATRTRTAISVFVALLFVGFCAPVWAQSQDNAVLAHQVQQSNQLLHDTNQLLQQLVVKMSQPPAATPAQQAKETAPTATPPVTRVVYRNRPAAAATTSNGGETGLEARVTALETRMKAVETRVGVVTADACGVEAPNSPKWCFKVIRFDKTGPLVGDVAALSRVIKTGKHNIDTGVWLPSGKDETERQIVFRQPSWHERKSALNAAYGSGISSRVATDTELEKFKKLGIKDGLVFVHLIPK